MAANRRAFVIGGSLGGLIAAHLLRGIGWDAVVFERNGTELESRGAGLGTHPALLEILRRIDSALGDTIGVEVRRVICLDRDGRVALELPTSRTMTAWGHLYAGLRRRLPPASYRLGQTLVGVEQDGHGVTATFAGGERASGDLLVAADGLRSTVRAQLFPSVQPSYAGYVAWRCTLDEREVPAAIHREIFDTYYFCLPEGEQLLGYPVPGRDNETRVGLRACNIVWYRPVDPDRALVDLCTDSLGRHHSAGIPPPLIRREVTAGIKAAARELLAPQVAAIIERAEPFFQPIYDLVSPQMAADRVVLLGDAAFVARPHLGAGVTKAALDADALAGSIEATGHDVVAAVARYRRLQQPLGAGMVALAIEEGAYLSAWSRPIEHGIARARHRDIASLITSHDTRRADVRRLIAERAARAGA